MFKKKIKLSKNIEQQTKQEVLPPVKKEPFRFKPGNTLGGRTKGSRNKFAEQFFTDFHADWKLHGVQVLQDCRKEDPATYLRVAAAIIPKELNIKEGESILETLLEQFGADQLNEFIAGVVALGAAQQGKGSETKALPRSKPNRVH